LARHHYDVLELEWNNGPYDSKMHEPLQNGVGTEGMNSSAFIEAHAPWGNTKRYQPEKKKK